MVKTPLVNERVMGLIPRSGRFPGGGNGNPFQYSCLEKPMDRGAWWATGRGVAKSRHNLPTKQACKHISISVWLSQVEWIEQFWEQGALFSGLWSRQGLKFPHWSWGAQPASLTHWHVRIPPFDLASQVTETSCASSGTTRAWAGKLWVSVAADRTHSP